MLITREDMITRFGETELAQRTGRDGYDSIDYAVLDTAIADADAEAGAYLKAANLSFDTAPHVLKLKVCDIARYYLYEDGYNQAVDERYRAAVAWFKTVVKNPNMLDGTRTAADASRYAVYANREPDLREWLES